MLVWLFCRVFSYLTADVDSIESVELAGDAAEGQEIRAVVNGFFDQLEFRW